MALERVSEIIYEEHDGQTELATRNSLYSVAKSAEKDRKMAAEKKTVANSAEVGNLTKPETVKWALALFSSARSRSRPSAAGNHNSSTAHKLIGATERTKQMYLFPIIIRYDSGTGVPLYREPLQSLVALPERWTADWRIWINHVKHSLQCTRYILNFSIRNAPPRRFPSFDNNFDLFMRMYTNNFTLAAFVVGFEVCAWFVLATGAEIAREQSLLCVGMMAASSSSSTTNSFFVNKKKKIRNRVPSNNATMWTRKMRI